MSCQGFENPSYPGFEGFKIYAFGYILPFLKGVPEGGGIYSPFSKGSTRRGRDLSHPDKSSAPTSDVVAPPLAKEE